MLSRIYLIRHGITQGNLNHWYYGSTDLPLTEGGYDRIRSYAEEGIYPELPEGTEIYTTGLIRTEQTLEAIYGECEHGAIENLRELKFGKAECKTYEELKQFENFEKWAWDKTGDARIADGETSNEFHQRIRKGLDELLDKHRLLEKKRAGSGKDAVTVLVCHGGVISCIMETLFPAVCGSMWDWLPEPGFGYAVDLNDGEPYMYSKINDIGRLGLGIYELPMLGKGRVDRKKTAELIDSYMEKGHGYFEVDISGKDMSDDDKQRLLTGVRTALVKRYERDRYKISLNINGEDIREAESYFKALGVKDPDRLIVSGIEDYYALGSSGKNATDEGVQDEKSNGAASGRSLAAEGDLGGDLAGMILERLVDIKHRGKVGKTGISFSGDPDLLDRILKDEPVLDFVELPVNYRTAFGDSERAQKYYTISRRRYKEILVNSVFDGGELATELPSGASSKELKEMASKLTDTMAGYAMLKEYNMPKSPVDWAIRYVLSLPFVTVCVAATKDPDHAREDLDSADRFRPLSEEEQAALRSSV